MDPGSVDLPAGFTLDPAPSVPASTLPPGFALDPVPAAPAAPVAPAASQPPPAVLRDPVTGTRLAAPVPGPGDPAWDAAYEATRRSVGVAKLDAIQRQQEAAAAHPVLSNPVVAGIGQIGINAISSGMGLYDPKGAQQIRQMGQEVVQNTGANPDSPTMQATQFVGGALKSASPLMIPEMISEAMGRARIAAQDARDKGLTVSGSSEAAKAIIDGTVTGVLQRYGLGNVVGAVGSPLRQQLAAAATNGLIGGLQQGAENVTQKTLIDPRQQLTEGVLPAAASGVAAGAMLAGAHALAGRGDVPQVQPPEVQVDAPQVQQAGPQPQVAPENPSAAAPPPVAPPAPMPDLPPALQHVLRSIPDVAITYNGERYTADNLPTPQSNTTPNNHGPTPPPEIPAQSSQWSDYMAMDPTHLRELSQQQIVSDNQLAAEIIGHRYRPNRDEDELFDKSNDAQRDRLFYQLRGEPLRDLASAAQNARPDTPQEAAVELSRLLTKLPESGRFDVEKMPDDARQAVYALKYIGQTIAENGWNSPEIQANAVRMAAHRYSDPEDAQFMLGRFLRTAPSTGAEQVTDAPLPLGSSADAPVVDASAGSPAPRSVGDIGVGPAGINDPVFSETDHGPTALRNEDIDRESAARGIASVTPDGPDVPKKQALLDSAKSAIATDPTAPERLVDELVAKPRNLTDTETVMVQLRTIELRKQFDALNQRIIDAHTAGDDGAAKSLDVQRAILEDKLSNIAAIAKNAGTEWAKTGLARQVQIAEDYSLAGMVTKKRASVGGRELTPAERESVQRQQKAIADSDAAVDQRRKYLDTAPTEGRPAVDPALFNKQAQAERARDTFRQNLMQDRLRNRTPTQKIADALVKWRRAFLLSSPVTAAKLTSAAAERMIVTPTEQVVGLALSRAFPRAAARAPREGSPSLTAELVSIRDAFTKGLKDSAQIMKRGSGGKSDLDVLYGKKSDYPPELINLLGNMHSALKAPAKRNEFSRSLQLGMEFAARQGLDVHDPMAQTRLALDAYKNANRSVFMQDNRVVDAYKRWLSTFDQPDKATGKIPASSKAIGTAARLALPIVRVPTNIVSEALDYAFGTVTGGTRLAKAYADGIDKLEPDQADLIFRQMKKGSLGAALLTLGYFGAQSVGGYYQPGEKRRDGDVKAGSVRLFGHDLPSYLLHNPLLEMLQIGATVRRIADSRLRKHDPDEQGIVAGAGAAAMGLANEVPFVREAAQVGQLGDPKTQGGAASKTATSMLVPQAVSWLAQYLDKDAQGETVNRKARGLIQNLQAATPGLRGDLPEAAPPPDPRMAPKQAVKETRDDARDQLPPGIQSLLSEKNRLDALPRAQLTPDERARRSALIPVENAAKQYLNFTAKKMPGPAREWQARLATAAASLKTTK